MKNQLFKMVIILVALFVGASYSYGQGKVTGKVKDAQTGEALIGAAVKVKGTTKGAITDESGVFVLNIDAGSITLEIAFIGYETVTKNVTVKNGEETKLGKIKLEPSSFGLGGINIIADRARERETPVAFSNVDQKQLQLQLGSQDLPMVMNQTPSAYASAQGGGAGDARINVRGFDQRNVAIMINGVPVNDMENGWVYWSNWDGIADATSSIQMQRGLSAVNLATPSIGGTMNILTSPANTEAGVSGRFEYGSGNFMKSTITGHTGLINGKYAISASMVRKVGEGVIDGTWTDAWAYYLGASYNINKNHRVEIYALGAPQRHGQNLYRQNVAAYSHDFAREIGADSATTKFAESTSGRLYNENWSPVSESYTGQQSWNGKTRDRYASNFINERENYYHKPITNVNWYAQWSDKVSQFTTVYYSGGTGGGTGTFGSVKWDYASEPTRIVDYDATIANNNDTAFGILRNSTNNQWTVGAISRFKIEVTDNLSVQAGVDWRTAEIEHYREVRDLLGGQFFVYSGNDFESGDQYNKGLGDKIAYFNTNTVDWLGFFAQGEYTMDKITAYGTFGYSRIKYTFTDHFADNGEGKEVFTESPWIAGTQIKGGLSYRPTPTLSVYGNYGYVGKVPIFDNVIDDGSGALAENPANEKFNAIEGGANYASTDNKLKVNANYYYTTWTDRASTRGVFNQDGTEGVIFLSGMNQTHSGFELEAKYRIIDQLGVGAIGSFGNWEYTDDVKGQYKDYDNGNDTLITYDFYVNGLKVGDAPQTQMAFWLDIFPVKGLQMQLIYRYNTNYYAGWDPFSRTDATDGGQVWQIPAFGLLDFHASYVLPMKGKLGIEVFAHIFNALDEIYISDATDNSPYNGFYGANNQFSHTANSAEVFVGLPRTFNIGTKITFK
jgi:iron complex outermembrane receptor protein